MNPNQFTKEDAAKQYIVIFDKEDFEKLRDINTKLYGVGRPFTPDERRDLANRMHAVLGMGYVDFK